MSRPRKLRSRLARNLVALGLVSVLLLAAINFVVARSLIENGIEDQVTGLRDIRIEALEGGFAQLEGRVSTMARDPGVVTALVELADGYAEIDEDLTDGEVAELEALYQDEILAGYDTAGVDHPPADQLVPRSVAGRYLQREYIARNPNPVDDRGALLDAGDGSTYSAAHARHSPFLQALATESGLTDLMLVSEADQEVVYTTGKRIDLGTHVFDGPYADTGLGESVETLSGVAAGDSVVVDTAYYLPAAKSATLFVAATIRSGSSVVGALAVQVPIEVLTDFTTAGQQWDLLGLGETGEAYIVGSDQTLRSNSRTWLEDPQSYLDRFEARGDRDEERRLIELLDSPVLVQTVDNEGVTTALEGDEFVGGVRNYLGAATLAATAPVDVAGLDWIVVAEQAKSETGEPLRTYVRRILLVLALLLPAIAIGGTLLAQGLVRPIRPLIGAAGRIAEGDLETHLPDLGRNELGDLARQLEAVAAELEERNAAIAAEDERIEGMLAAVLPARLVARVRDGEHAIADMLDTATVLSASIVDLPDAVGADQETVIEATTRITAEIDVLMERHEVERVRVSSDHQLFLTGLGHDAPEVDAALRFAVDLAGTVAAVGADLDLDVGVKVGIAAGEVATGVLGANQLSFGVWGDAPGLALTLGTIARRGEILADPAVADHLDPSWVLRPVDDLVGLAGEPVAAVSITAS